MKNETEDYLSSKLKIYRLTLAFNYEKYMNNFLTSSQELRKNPGEAIQESYALSLILRGIKDPDLDMTV